MQLRGVPELVEEVHGQGQLGARGVLAEEELLKAVETRRLRR